MIAFDIHAGDSYVCITSLRKIMTGFFLRFGSRDLQKIGFWCLMPAALLTAIILPTLLLPLVLTVSLIVIQEILSVFSFASPQCASINCHATLRLRSPPSC